MQKKLSHLVPPALLLAISALLSRFLGVFRDHYLAKTFGATSGSGIFNLDVYYAAFRVPDLVYNLLVVGAVSAAFIPIFTQYKKENDKKNAWEFASSVLHILLLAILVLGVAMYFFAPALARLVAGGFTPEQLELTSRLMRIMLLSPIFFAVASVLIGIQDSFKTFFYRSLGPIFYNIGIIFGILMWGQRFGVVGITWGVILGAALQLIIQLPSLWQVGYKHVWMLGFRRPDVRKSLKLIIPRVIGASIDQVTLMASTFIASFLATGSITVFFLAINLQAMPLGVISMSFAITSFATLSELASESTPDAFAKEIRKIIGRVLFLIVPSIFGILALRSEIVRVILAYGKFTAADAALASKVLAFLVVSLFAQSLLAILARGFYSFHDTKTPLLSGILSGAIAIGGSFLLAVPLKLGIVGIALGFSLGDILDFTVMYLLLSKKVHANILDWGSLLKMLCGSLIMGAVVVASKFILPIEGSPLSQLAILCLDVGVGILVYFGLAGLLGIHEVHMMKVWARKPIQEAPQDSEMKTAEDLMD
jgi:putative peptidoglycan lipid II flippase